MEPTAPKPIAIWNTARDAWEAPQTNGLFCEHLDVYSGTFPTSGMTLNGVAYELPTWGGVTDASESSFSDNAATLAYLGTPTSRMWKGAGPQGGPTQIRNKARGLIEAQVMDIEPRLLPTVTVSDTNGPGIHGAGGLDLRTTVSLLPTPVAQPSGNTPENHLRKKPGRSVVTDLAILVENGLLGTGGQLPGQTDISEVL